MSEENKTRFRSAEEALRFYFRLRELLYSGRTRRLVADELPADACTIAANALDDCQCIGWSMRGLDDLALWLLGEIYGPTCFGVHRRTFSHACKAGGLEFPDREFRLRDVGMIHERALGVVKRGLRKLGMIPGRQVKTAREGRPLKTVRKRAHLHGSQAANRG
ncbi:MAG TPA: hypothetical protein VJX68_09235 [Candidatus Binatus sp.]|uniref:hypothetical protein n=1 Tax=Candidatus Binatus sp. TaxID=2811406 RepID=UPI002B48004D|nr:hypothetical protein [Candidatus Binatus sp.]HKN13368.1 hypothetical protein [Candidatus Binatus sp.]